MNKINVVYALITDESRSKILMVNDIDNGWTFPGGKVEEDESLECALIREAKEETEYDIKAFGIVTVNEKVFVKDDLHVLFFTFRAEIVGGTREIVNPDEISEIEWLDIKDVDELLPYYKEGLELIVNSGIEVTYFNEGEVT